MAVFRAKLCLIFCDTSLCAYLGQNDAHFCVTHLYVLIKAKLWYFLFRPPLAPFTKWIPAPVSSRAAGPPRSPDCRISNRNPHMFRAKLCSFFFPASLSPFQNGSLPQCPREPLDPRGPPIAAFRIEIPICLGQSYAHFFSSPSYSYF